MATIRRRTRVWAVGTVCGLAWALGACEQKPVSPPPLPPVPPPQTKSADAVQQRGAPTTQSTMRSTPPAARIAVVPAREPSGTFLDRPERPGVFRVVSYNVKWNSIFPQVSEAGATKFARVVRALDPDVLGLQEIGVHPEDRDNPNAKAWNADDVRQLLDAVRPLPDGAKWHAYGANSNIIASKYPLQMQTDRVRPQGERGPAIALVVLPPELLPQGLYLVNTHHKCCGGVDNDPRRQLQSDAIMAWIRDARSPGDAVDLDAGAGLIILGDFNLVGGPQPLSTLLDGNIIDEKRHGPDFRPDWDETALTDAKPMHNIDGSESWTWRDDNQPFEPGRLDYIVYSDSVLEAVRKFALNTTAMSDEELEAAGLQRWDVCKDEIGREYDHLPLVVDFIAQGSPPPADVDEPPPDEPDADEAGAHESDAGTAGGA